MTYFDTHAHYFDARFTEDPNEPVDALLSRLFEENVSYIVNVGTSPETSRLAIGQARRYPGMYTAIGIHPTDGQELADPDAALSEIESLIRDPESKCVAVGEIGLDYHYPDTQKELQRYYFERQMEMAKRLDLPVIIHDRDAHGDVLAVIAAHPGVRGVVHSFSGSAEMAAECVRRGYYVSFSGTLTFTNARKVTEAALAVPPERLLIETDAPYLAPHPLRGTKNHSGNLSLTCRKLSELFCISEEEAAALTERNAKTFYRLL